VDALADEVCVQVDAPLYVVGVIELDGFAIAGGVWDVDAVVAGVSHGAGGWGRA
jgi:hypothetical protein